MLFAIRGQSSHLLALAQAATLEEQRQIYEKDIRPVVLSGFFVKLLLSNPVFLWNSLGVPMNQLAMLTTESSELTYPARKGTTHFPTSYLLATGVRQYCMDTLDPIGRTIHIRTSNYHYYLAITSRYNSENPPRYLTRSGFAALKLSQSGALESFRLHTDSLYNVIRTIDVGSLDVWIGMVWQNGVNMQSRVVTD